MTAFSKGTVLSFSAAVEIGTGLAFALLPMQMVMLLLGAEMSGPSVYLTRMAGIAILSLGIACLPGRWGGEGSGMAVKGLAAYNLLMGLYLAWLGAGVHMSGLLLWPAVVLHLVVGILLLR
jgi:hypothetical protein